MQVLKDDIYNRILEHAEILFYEEGYSGASMRELARQVGVSFSNLYRYFKNKGDLYDALMQPYVAHFMETIGRSLQHTEDDPAGGEHIRLVLVMLVRLIRTDRRKFVILLEGSRGTRHESLRAEMIQAIRERIAASLAGKAEQVPLLLHILAANLLQAVLEISKNTPDDEALVSHLENLIVYHLGGIQKLKA